MDALSNDELVDHVYAVWGERYNGDVTAKFAPEDVDEELLSIARMWLTEYTGDFEFLVSVKMGIEQENKQFTAGAAKGVLNCMVAEAKRKRGISGGGGGKKINHLPGIGLYAVELNDYIDLYQVKAWTPKGTDKKLLMVQGRNIPDAQHEWEMVAVIDPEQMTYNILRKITDEVMRETIRMLVESTKDEQLEYTKKYREVTMFTTSKDIIQPGF